MSHATGPQIAEYHSTGADVNKPPKAQSQRRTKEACLQKPWSLATRKARNEERRQFSMQKIIQRVKSLTFSIIRKVGNRNSKRRISLREIWVITKYTRSEYTQQEQDSRKYLLVYQKVVPVLVISIFIAQTKAEGDQPTLPRWMLGAYSTKEKI